MSMDQKGPAYELNFLDESLSQPIWSMFIWGHYKLKKFLWLDNNLQKHMI